MKDFIEKILETLNASGFPDRRVSLPTEKMYEVADLKGLSLNNVLEVMKIEHGVDAQIGPDKIIFTKIEAMQKSQENIMQEAQEMLSKMDPSELQKLQEMFSNMSPEEKNEIMKRGRDLGLI